MNTETPRRFDAPLLLLTFTLVALGLATIYSASAFIASDLYKNPWHFVQRQGVGVGVGMVAMLALARLPYRRLQKYAVPLYWFSVVSLALVWIPGIGHTANGASRWFGIAGFHFQPAEIVKVTMLIGLATWLHRHRADVAHPQVLGLAAVALAVPLGLIIAQPDFGSFLIICVLCGLMVFLAGIPLRWFAPIAGVGVLGLVGVAIAEPYRMKRLTSFLDPLADCGDDGYQVCQSLLALHHGGLAGQGPGEGVIKLHYLPEPHNDFIAAVLGEELGLWGMIGLLVLYLAFAWRGITIAKRAPDTFGMLLGSTFTVMIVGQACLNLGVAMSVVPPKGLVLPFMSYGVSAMVVNLAAVGVLLSVSAEALPERVEAPGGAAVRA